MSKNIKKKIKSTFHLTSFDKFWLKKVNPGIYGQGAWTSFGAYLYAICLPLHEKLASFAILIWVVLSLLDLFQKGFNKASKFNWVLPAIFLVYVISILLAQVQLGQQVEQKLSLLVFPFIFYAGQLSAQTKENMLHYYLYGLLAALAICVGKAVIDSFSLIEGHWNFKPNIEPDRGFFESVIFGGNRFFGSYFSIFHQTVYFGMYLTAGISVLLFAPSHLSKRKRIWFVAIFCLGIFLISNKASFVVLGLLFLLKVFSIKFAIWKKGMVLIAFFGLCIIAVAFNPRFSNSFEKIINGEIQVDPNARYDFKTRILSWDAAWQLILEKPILGYGKGKEQTALNKYYEEKGYVFARKNQYNAHNQYLQIWLECGIMGLMLFLAALFQMAYAGFGSASLYRLGLPITLVFIVNALFESYLNRFSGVSFFSFWACFLISAMPFKKMAP